MTGFVKAERHPNLKPPISTVGVLGWLRANLFHGWMNSLLTLAVLAAALQVLPPLVRWAFIDAVWAGSPDLCRQANGACWSVITENLRFITFGFYPHDQHWRPAIAVLLLVGLLAASRNRQRWGRPLGIAWAVGLVTMGVLLKGGVLGLTDVETALWSGLPLTLLLAVFGMVAAYPLGVLLALGRRSPMPVVGP